MVAVDVVAKKGDERLDGNRSTLASFFPSKIASQILGDTSSKGSWGMYGN